MKKHEGHTFTYNQDERRGYIATITEDGNIDVGENYDSAVIGDTFLYCETCNVKVVGKEIGASEFWEAV